MNKHDDKFKISCPYIKERGFFRVKWSDINHVWQYFNQNTQFWGVGPGWLGGLGRRDGGQGGLRIATGSVNS